jgi:hypothetical protein
MDVLKKIGYNKAKPLKTKKRVRCTMYSRQSSSVGTFLFGSLLGLGIGSLLALLLTPTSGEGIRTWVQKKWSDCPCWQPEKSNSQVETSPVSVEAVLADDPYENEVGY